jgi:hypothetical protein
MRAPPILHVAAGFPAPRRDTREAAGRCYWCASPIDGACCDVDDVITDSFTDQDQALVRDSALLCVACTWTMTGRPPDTLRLWSVAWREDGAAWPPSHDSAPKLGERIHLHNKGNPSAFRALLREPPSCRWICSIADSGQIHTAPFARVNRGERYCVRYERVDVHATAAQYRDADDACRDLMARGYTKLDILGEPHPSRLIACGLEAWRLGMRRLAPVRGSALLDLVLFLLRKDDCDDRRRANEDSDRSGARDDGERQQREDPPHRVVEPRQERAGDRGAERGQLQLAGFDDGAQAPDRRDDDLHGRGRRAARGRGRR